MTSYVSESELDLYYKLFQNRSPYKPSQIKLTEPTVSKLGIMQQTGRIPAISGSINFSKALDASEPSTSSLYRIPIKTAGLSSLSEAPLPKAVSVYQEFNPDKVGQRKDAYSLKELIEWYERFTGLKAPTTSRYSFLADLVLEKYNEQTKPS